MKKLAFALPAAALLAMMGQALAADVVGGQVSSANPSTGELTLTTGQHYRISQPVLLTGIMPGEHVIVTTNDDHSIGFSEDPSQFEDTAQ